MVDIDKAPEMHRRDDDKRQRLDRILAELQDNAADQRQGAVLLEIQFVYRSYSCVLKVSSASDPAMLLRLDLLAKALQGLGANGAK